MLHLFTFAANIEEKIKIIKQMEPSHIEHFIPLMRVEAADLENYKCRIVENNAIGSAHPIYYFSTKLDVSRKRMQYENFV